MNPASGLEARGGVVKANGNLGTCKKGNPGKDEIRYYPVGEEEGKPSYGDTKFGGKKKNIIKVNKAVVLQLFPTLGEALKNAGSVYLHKEDLLTCDRSELKEYNLRLIANARELSKLSDLQIGKTGTIRKRIRADIDDRNTGWFKGDPSYRDGTLKTGLTKSADNEEAQGPQLTIKLYRDDGSKHFRNKLIAGVMSPHGILKVRSGKTDYYTLRGTQR